MCRTASLLCVLQCAFVIQLGFVSGKVLHNHPLTEKYIVGADTLFAKIIRKEVPCDFIYEDDKCVAFNDIHPAAPIHFLVIPKKRIKSIAHAADRDAEIIGHMMIVAKKVAIQKMMTGYRIVINTGKDTNLYTSYLHLHVMGGRLMHWPPG